MKIVKAFRKSQFACVAGAARSQNVEALAKQNDTESLQAQGKWRK